MVIERAKGVLAQTDDLEMDAAFARLVEVSEQTGRSLAQVAQGILDDIATRQGRSPRLDPVPIDDSTRPRVAGSVELTPRQRVGGLHLRMIHDHFRQQLEAMTRAVEAVRDGVGRRRRRTRGSARPRARR